MIAAVPLAVCRNYLSHDIAGIKLFEKLSVLAVCYKLVQLLAADVAIVSARLRIHKIFRPCPTLMHNRVFDYVFSHVGYADFEELQTLCVRSAESPRPFYLVSVNSAAHYNVMMHVPALFAKLYDGYVFHFARSRFFIESFDPAQEVLKIPLRFFRRFGSCIIGIVETYRKIAISKVRMQQLNELTLRILCVQKFLRLARFSVFLSPALCPGMRLFRHGV